MHLSKFMLPKRRVGSDKTILWLPNEDFGISKNIQSRHFVSTFHTPGYSIWAKSDEKCLRNVLTECFSAFQNLRLGSINFVSTFHTPNYSTWAKSDEKRLQNVLSEYFSTFPTLRLGA